MRRLIGIFVVMAVAAGHAGATDLPKGKSEGPPSGGSGPGGGGASLGSATNESLGGGGGVLEVRKGGQNAKWWEIAAGFETHGLFIQSDLQGAARSKLFNYGYLSARVDLSRHDRIGARWGFYEYLLADQEETGLRSTDISLYYSHLFNLPWKLDLRATASVTAPVSFYSQRAGLITSPIGSLELDRSFGNFTIDLRGFGGGFIVRYNTPVNGGNPNTKAIVGGLLEADYKMWFHPALTLGADIYTAYLWYYDVGFAPDPNITMYGAIQPTSQPVQQVYGGEIFVRYAFPTFYGFRADATVALANGDPTLGYNSVIHDGIQHVFGIESWRQYLGMYGGLTVRY